MKPIHEIIAEIRASGFRRMPGVGDIGCYDRNMLLALCDSHDALEKALAATESDYMAVRRSLLAERDRLKEALSDLMPFVLESYYPQCATPEFKSAVEAARKLTE